MITPKEDPKWAQLLKGQIPHSFRILAGAMMVSKCQRNVAKDPSPQTVKKHIDELHTYFSQHEKAFGDDLRAIFN
jgi:hypothetical protein